MTTQSEIDQIRELRRQNVSQNQIALRLGIAKHVVARRIRIDNIGIDEERRRMREARRRSDAKTGRKYNEQPLHLPIERHVYRTPRQVVDRSPTVREMVEAFARGSLPREVMLAAYAPGYVPQPGKGGMHGRLPTAGEPSPRTGQAGSP